MELQLQNCLDLDMKRNIKIRAEKDLEESQTSAETEQYNGKQDRDQITEITEKFVMCNNYLCNM